MPTSEAEQKDLDAMKAAQAEQRELFFSMGREILRMNEAQLKTIGQKTIEGALRSNFEHYLKACDNLAKAHVKKWPD